MIALHRGDLWTYQALARTKTVLVVSADELNASGLPMTVDVTDVRPTGLRAMLATTLPGHGYILGRSLVAADPDRFRDFLGTAPEDTMEALGAALTVLVGL
ncbi:type II toxin-antitoxin system PemK/MazF family toxin [Nocardia acidivorans]|uniref:type II toxin-antitoxin system PemK/MazF family toxin n=1 Tax=Nocardia acidivorans TaxID=404580 RepID=UPI00083764D7|nr:type II toxin-antitoxin system PemK/MazF family toxin [Nocardia acidivorans]